MNFSDLEDSDSPFLRKRERKTFIKKTKVERTKRIKESKEKDHSSNDYILTRCLPYSSLEEQPVQIYLNVEPLIIMEIHAHLHSNEIIGFLSGQ